VKIGALILIPLAAFFMATLISVQNPSQPLTFSGNYTLNQQYSVNNLTLSSLAVGAILAAIIVATVLAGINILGSGLSPEAVHVIYLGVAWGALYAILAVPSYQVFSTMPFGDLIFLVLSLMFLLGVIGQVSRGS
jgi:hypothetical protein